MRLLLCHASSNIGVDGWWCVERKRMHEIKKEELNSLGQDASCTVAHPLEPATVRERGWEEGVAGAARGDGGLFRLAASRDLVVCFAVFRAFV